MTTTVKTCFKCHITKPVTDFYVHKQMRDGRLNKCKECTKSDSYISRHILHRERTILYDRFRYKSNQDRRNSSSEIVSRNHKQHPERRSAASKVANAVKRGELVKHPCFICGAKKVEAHHADYSSPLDVIWLCTQHHKDAHAMHYWLTKKDKE